MSITVFDIKGVPGTRRERIEAAVVAGGRHAPGPHEAWIAADPVSVAEKKGTKMAAKWSPVNRAVWSEPFPPLRVLSWNGPQAVKGAPLLGAAKRTLDGEDRSEMITEEGKAGRTFGEKWSCLLYTSDAADE